MECLATESGTTAVRGNFTDPLVNQNPQEYHAPSVFTSHVADILKTSVICHAGPQTA